MRDFFRPQFEPAMSIYDAFQKEAEKRDQRSFEEWTAAEQEAVWRAAQSAAKELGLAGPTREDVAQAEITASGHVDYGAKWAYGVTDAIHRSKRTIDSAYVNP